MSMNGIAALVGWAMILWRLPRVQLRSVHARYTFATLVCFTLAATFSTPLVIAWVDGRTGLPGLSFVTEYLFAIAAAVVWALSCLSLDNTLLSRGWLLWLAPVVMVCLLAIWWFFQPELRAESLGRSDGEILLTVLAQGYAFAIVTSIAVPVLARRVTNETALPIRLRLVCILATQVILAVWLGATMTLGPLVLFGVAPRSSSFSFVNVLIALMILAYTMSLLPPPALVYVAKRMIRVRDWIALRRLRRVERRIAQLLDVAPIGISRDEAWDTPEYSLYRVTIAILDRRKSLDAAASDSARRLGWRLNQLVTTAPDYFQLVRELQRIDAR